MKTRLLLLLLFVAASHAGLYVLGKGTARGMIAAREEQPEGRLSGKASERGADRWHRVSGAAAALPQDPHGLLAELERHDSGQSLAEFRAARAELFRRWIRSDLRGAMDLLYAPENLVRYQGAREAVAAELREEMLRHAEQVAEWIAARRYGSSSSEVARAWTEALLAAGQTAPVLESLPRMPFSGAGDAFVALARQADAAQLAEMGKMLRQREAGWMRRWPGAEQAYALRKVQLAGKDPGGLFTGLREDDTLYGLIRETWVKHEAVPLQREQAVAAIMALPDKMRSRAVSDLVNAERRGGYLEAAKLLNTLDAAGLVGAASGDDALEIVHAVLRYNGRPYQSYDGTAEFLEQAQAVKRDDLRHVVLHRTFRFYSPSSVVDLIEQLPELPPGPDRDALLSGPASNPEMPDKHRGILLEAIDDQEIKVKILQQVAERERMKRGEEAR